MNIKDMVPVEPPQTIAEPTAMLRFVRRGGKLMLEQLHICSKVTLNTHKVHDIWQEWREVPTEDAT